MDESEKVDENHVARAARARSAADDLTAALLRIFDEFVEGDPPALPRFPHAFFAVNEFHAQVICGMEKRWQIMRPADQLALRAAAIRAFTKTLEERP